MNTLRECPFCGDGAHFNGGDPVGFCVNCDNPACYGSLGDGEERNLFRSEAEAAMAWNRRASDTFTVTPAGKAALRGES
jgi:hypothetical protein